MYDTSPSYQFVIRRVVLWRWKSSATVAERLRAKEGLAYVRFASPSVDELDFGEDIGVGSPTNHDLALERDHADRTRWDAYNDDPHHQRVGDYIDTLTDMDATARIDWECSGAPTTRGMLRHVSLHYWRDGATEADRSAVVKAVDALRVECPTLRGLETGDDLGWRPGHADWVLEARFDDVEGWRAFLEHPAQQTASATIDSVTSAERLARIEHLVRSG